MQHSDVLIVSDFDFTLTDSHHDIPAANRRAIERWMAAGGAFTVGTGRARDFFAPQAGEVPTNAPCVVSNGAALYDYGTGETLYMAAFSAAEQAQVPALLAQVRGELRLNIESGYDTYMPEELWAALEPDGWMPRFWRERAHDPAMQEQLSKLPKLTPPKHAPLAEIPQPWIKLLFTGEQPEIDALAARAEALGLCGVHSMPGMYEIQPAGVDKGSGARRLARMLGRSVLVCVGDAPNDTAMLREADFGFVPVSAGAEMQAMGFLPCAHIDEGAVADVIAQLERNMD